MLMACLIIVTSTAKDNVYSCGKAHADPLVAYSGSMCAFFCGDGLPVRVSCGLRNKDMKAAKEMGRATDHAGPGEVYVWGISTAVPLGVKILTWCGKKS